MTGPKDPRQSVKLRDVTLRDGLQLTGGVLPTEAKLEIIRTLVEIGVPYIEVGSMARPDLVPSMANTVEVLQQLTPEERDVSWVWTATPRNVSRATDAGATRMQYCLSVSTAHNEANVGRTTTRSMDDLPEALDIAENAGAELQFTLATAFTCPFEGKVDPARVLELIADERVDRCTELVICDTLGQADPQEVFDLIQAAAMARPDHEIVFHGHDTWGLGVANTLAAIDAGAGTVDAALGGLGGCPFAPGASGNTATEDLLFALKPTWLTPEKFGALVRLGNSITSRLGEPNTSRAAQGSVSRSKAFAWVQQN